MQPYPAQQPTGYYVAPTDGGAVWTLVMAILGFFLCPVLGLIAFFTGGSAVSRIQASQGRLQGDGIARVGRILGCFLAFTVCGLGLASLSHLPIPSPSP